MESREKLPLPLSAARHTCAKHQWLARVVRLAIRLLYTAIAAIAVNAIVRHGFEWQSSLADGLADFFVHLNGEAALSEPSRLLREDPICPQVEPWTRPPDIAPLPTTPPREMLAKLLSGAVQVDTSVYDDFPLPVESDPELWARVFEPFQRYLAQAFPNVHNAPDKITLEVINEHGLLYTWKGKNATLPPLIFMAHQDVVPVDPSSVDEWEHEPFSGYVDLEKELVYGRGASDDKASLVSLLASFSSLLASGFEPQRTLVLSFGFDEEASGTQGARQLAKRLEEVYGSHREGRGAYMIVDEGSGIDADLYGLTVAGPAVAEKGYIDVRITVKTPGGHSSDPPQHTSIGILSRVIAAIEDRPWTPTMGIREDDPRYTEGSAERADALDAPGLETLLCLHDAPKIQSTPVGKALHEFITARKRLAHVRSTVARNILASLSKQWLLKRELRRLYRARYQLLAVVVDSGEFKTFATTQAVDIISGGVKINALPEKATAVINHRINAEQSVEDVRQHLRAIIKPVVHKLGLTVDAWGETASTLGSSCAPTSAFHSERDVKAKGTVVVEDAFDSPLESAPRTPTHGKGAGPYRLLSSVIRSSWQLDDPRYPLGASNQTQSAGQRSYFKDEERLVRVAPTLMEGNTDTHSYWNLTQHIFRFSPNTLAPMRDGNIPDDGNIHTVNEAVHIDTLVAGFEFYTALMVAAQDGAQIHS